MKIALVDDEQECLKETEQLCGSFGDVTGYQVDTIPFDSGEAFLQAFEAGGV